MEMVTVPPTVGVGEEVPAAPGSQAVNAAGVLTIEMVQQAVPEEFRLKVTQEWVDQLNSLGHDQDTNELIQQNMVSYVAVIKEGRWSMQDYTSAVQYVSFKLMGYTNLDSWKKTFPQRHTRLVAQGIDSKGISAHVAAYHKNKLVNRLMEQSMTPAWLVNQHVFQQAINRQAWLMRNARSEMVQTTAANSLLNALKRPEAAKIELEIGVRNDDGLRALNEAMTGMAEQQLAAIRNGAKTKDTINGAIVVDAEYREVK